MLRGTSGADRICGFGGDDTLIGGDGWDELRGGAGNDRLVGGRGRNALYGDAGDDKLFGGAVRDTLAGGTGADRLDGGSGRDDLFGNGGDDLLLARDGATDSLNGGAGFDRARVDAGLRDRVTAVERLLPMRVLTALLAAAVLATTASAQVAAKSPGEDDPGSFPSWSPDGSRLTVRPWPRLRRRRRWPAYAQQRLPRRPASGRRTERSSRSSARSKVYVADANGADPRQIAEGQRLLVVPGQPPARDREHVALRGRRRRNGPAADHAADPVHDVSCPVPHAAPNWSPRGDWIAFVDAINHDGIHGSGTLHVVRPDGTGEQEVGSTLFPSGISWSPDGRWLGYSDSYDFSERTEFFVARESDGFRSRLVGDGDGGTWAPTSRYVIRRERGRPLRDPARRRREANHAGIVPLVVARRGATGIPTGRLDLRRQSDRRQRAARDQRSPSGLLSRAGRSPTRASAAARGRAFTSSVPTAAGIGG